MWLETACTFLFTDQHFLHKLPSQSWIWWLCRTPPSPQPQSQSTFPATTICFLGDTPGGMDVGRGANSKLITGTLEGLQLTDLGFDQTVQDRCIPDSATPCWEPINKQFEEWLSESSAFRDNKPLNASKSPQARSSFQLLSRWRKRMFVQNPGRKIWLYFREETFHFHIWRTPPRFRCSLLSVFDLSETAQDFRLGFAIHQRKDTMAPKSLVSFDPESFTASTKNKAVHLPANIY